MDSQRKDIIVDITEAFKGVFTKEEIEKMEKDFEEWKKKSLEEKNAIVEAAVSSSRENQNPIDY